MFVSSYGSTLLALLHLDHVRTCLGKVLLALQHLANFKMVLGSFLLALQHSNNVLAYFEQLAFINFKSKYATMSLIGLMPCFLHIISMRGSILIFATEAMT